MNMVTTSLQLILGFLSLLSGSRCSQMLLYKGCQVLQVPLAAVLLRLLAILINVERGEPVDSMSAAQFPVCIPIRCAVHVADRHLSIVFVFLGKFLPSRCQPLTVATPGSKELDKGDPSFDFGVKVVLPKFGNRRGCGRLRYLSILGGCLAGLALRCCHKLLQLRQCTGALVSFHFRASPEVGEGRITPDFVLLAHSLVLGAIDLGNFHLLIFLKSLGKLIPSRGKLLTVATPGSIELDKSVPFGDCRGERGTGEDVKS